MTGAAAALAGIRVLELSAKGPGPFGVMLLADLGADVIRIDRPSAPARTVQDATARGRRSIAIDLKQERGVELVLALVERADVLVEGYRPGIAERLGIGPETCLERNPRLVYARMTGWGQDGPLARRAGHDINFLSVAGALYPLGAAEEPPSPPLNLVGDFGGGGTYLAIGVLAALLERDRSGRGQVVDAAMVDGVSSLLTAYHSLLQHGLWSEERESNLVDGGAPWYRAYRTADGGYVAVGALEPPFWTTLLELLELDPADWPQYAREDWPRQRRGLAQIFETRTRDDWEQLFDGSDACVSPVLTLSEATRAPQLAGRGTFVELDGRLTPAPAPRLSRTPGNAGGKIAEAGEHTDAILAELGLTGPSRDELRAAGVVA